MNQRSALLNHVLICFPDTDPVVLFFIRVGWLDGWMVGWLVGLLAASPASPVSLGRGFSDWEAGGSCWGLV